MSWCLANSTVSVKDQHSNKYYSTHSRERTALTLVQPHPHPTKAVSSILTRNHQTSTRRGQGRGPSCPMPWLSEGFLRLGLRGERCVFEDTRKVLWIDVLWSLWRGIHFLRANQCRGRGDGKRCGGVWMGRIKAFTRKGGRFSDCRCLTRNGGIGISMKASEEWRSGVLAFV